MELSLRDLSYERELLRPVPDADQPSHVRIWLSYLNLKKVQYLTLDYDKTDLPPADAIAAASDPMWLFYDRAVRRFPRSYKLWSDYCDTRSSYVAQFLLSHERSTGRTNGTYERALLNLWTCPRLWEDYLSFLGRQGRLTLLRRTMNRAIQSLPITQHDRLWACCLGILRDSAAHHTVADAYQRFLQLHPEHIEDACDYFITQKATKLAASFIRRLLDSPSFASLSGRNKYFWWSQLATLIGVDADIDDAERLLRDGCRDFVVETGRMWVLIGEHLARLGRFADAIQTFDDALNSTTTARDFCVVFEGAAQLLLAIESATSEYSGMYERKLNDLLDRREHLLNATLLRENVNNVGCWIQRVALYLDYEYNYNVRSRHDIMDALKDLTDQQGQLLIFIEAIESVDPRKACDGAFCDLWINLSVLLDQPHRALELALSDSGLLSSDVLGVYRYYAELELRNHREMSARELLYRAISDRRVQGSKRIALLWNLLLDVEWSFGGVAATRDLFERCVGSRMVTQRHIIAYAAFLEESAQFEDMFRVFEKGIELSGWPYCGSIWLMYLQKFVKFVQGGRRERARDLFEEALREAPSKESLPIFVLYARFEEDFGLFARAMDVYRRGVDCTQSDDLLDVWIAAACRHLGVGGAREPYELAIGRFRGQRAVDWCVKYAGFEARLTEFDRARAIYAHGTQFANPEECAGFWDSFERFEQTHGTRETYQEMLSQKNLARAKFNTSVHVGIARAGLGGEDEDQELADAEATRIVMEQEQKIPETIFDAGSFTVLERFQRKKK
jgi:pre-mRNA-splicing factor SYF1